MYPFITVICSNCGEKLEEWEKLLSLHSCQECLVKKRLRKSLIVTICAPS